MAIKINHKFASEKTDGPDPTIIQPSHWNETHKITLATDTVMGRKTAGDGEVEELTLSKYASSPADGEVARYGTSGRFRIGDAVQDYDAINKGQADGEYVGKTWFGDRYLDIVTSFPTDNPLFQSRYILNQILISGGNFVPGVVVSDKLLEDTFDNAAIPIRKEGGVLRGPAPVDDLDYVNKGAMDSKLSNYWTSGETLKRFGGAQSTGGVLDWNAAENTKPGIGPTLLLGSATNGPGDGQYYFVWNLEFSANQDGTGQITQIAMPYTNQASVNGGPFWYRGRYSGTWSSWVRTYSTVRPPQISEIPSLQASLDAKANNSRFTISTADPSGGVNGDVWFKV